MLFRSLDKTAPDYHLQVDAIYRSICARYMGGEEETTTVFDRQMYIVENSKNEQPVKKGRIMRPFLLY